MDLRVFYQKIRSVENEIKEPHVVVLSLDTPDGGKAGLRTEVSRGHAAKMVVEGSARLASVEEAEEFRTSVKRAWRKQQRIAAKLSRELGLERISEDSPNQAGEGDE